MKEKPTVRILPDGHRLHMNDGPIDLIVEAFGMPEQIHRAYGAAGRRFATILDELCNELPRLRQPARADTSELQGVVARSMWTAVKPFAAEIFITPMAAVAGAVAEEILNAMTSAANLSRAYANDGGDIAIHLSHGEQFTIGMIDKPEWSGQKCGPALFGSATVYAAHPVRGIATSGWRGRSFSLGIADAVTVLADRATMADAAATVISNAVDLPGHTAIVRVPTCEIAPDNDLGDHLVTRGVAYLTANEISEALNAGASIARQLLARDLIRAAALHLQGETRLVGSGSELQMTSIPDAQTAGSLASA